MKKLWVLIASLVGMCGIAAAQGGMPAPGPDVVYAQQVPDTAPPPPNIFIRTERIGAGGRNAGYVAFRGDRKPVLGAPYTATAVTETTQVLADGNRIVNKSTTTLARDSQGRTRREEHMGRIGPLAVHAPQMAFIHDPVANVDYVLDLNEHTAQVIHLGEGGPAPGMPPPPPPIGRDGAPELGQQRVIISEGASELTTEKRIVVLGGPENGDMKTESLGTQVIEGVVAEGKRVTHTIPAGEIGNERPLVITSEVWTSPELHEVVLSKRNDPRFGKTVYRLTNISRSEPDAALFQVPANFTQRDMPGPTVRRMP